MTGYLMSTIIVGRFYRFAATSDNYADPIFGIEVDFHFKKDSNGSRIMTGK